MLYLANQIFSNNAQNATKYWQVLVLTIEQNEHFPLHKMYPSSVNGMNFQNSVNLESIGKKFNNQTAKNAKNIINKYETTF